MTTIGAALFDEVRERWAAQIGREALEALEAHLDQLVGRRPPEVSDLADLTGGE